MPGAVLITIVSVILPMLISILDTEMGPFLGTISKMPPWDQTEVVYPVENDLSSAVTPPLLKSSKNAKK
jgi:hypothetical protein